MAEMLTILLDVELDWLKSVCDAWWVQIIALLAVVAEAEFALFAEYGGESVLAEVAHGAAGLIIFVHVFAGLVLANDASDEEYEEDDG